MLARVYGSCRSSKLHHTAHGPACGRIYKDRPALPVSWWSLSGPIIKVSLSSYYCYFKFHYP